MTSAPETSSSTRPGGRSSTACGYRANTRHVTQPPGPPAEVATSIPGRRASTEGFVESGNPEVGFLREVHGRHQVPSHNRGAQLRVIDDRPQRILDKGLTTGSEVPGEALQLKDLVSALDRRVHVDPAVAAG